MNEPKPIPVYSETARAALVILAIVAAGAALWWLRGILTPLALAIFLMILIDGLSRNVRKVLPFVPERAALPAALTLIVVAFMGAIWIVIDGFSSFANRSIELSSRLDSLIAQIAAMFHMKVAPSVDQLLSQLGQPGFLNGAAGAVQTAASDALFVLTYLGFLMASRAGLPKKARALFHNSHALQDSRTIANRIRDGVESYVWIQAVTGVMIALPAFGVMAALGLEDAGFWAFLIFLFNFVPIVGGLIAVAGPTLFALVQFDQWWKALELFAALQVILFIVGSIIFPRMQAKSQNIDPVVVLLSFFFWGAIWGMAGAFLSTPLTVIAIAICAEFKGSRWVAILLSGDGEPYPDVTAQPAAEPSKGLFGFLRPQKITEP